MRTGVAHLLLHGGRALRSPLSPMVGLSRAMLRLMAEESGLQGVLLRPARHTGDAR